MILSLGNKSYFNILRNITHKDIVGDKLSTNWVQFDFLRKQIKERFSGDGVIRDDATASTPLSIKC